MASEASWQTGTAEKEADRDVPPSVSQMDPRTVESLLRMLLARVADSDRRYGEAVDELHARLDQLSPQTTDTVVPAAIEALSARMDEIAGRLDQALDQILKIENLQVEPQLSEMEQANVKAMHNLAVFESGREGGTPHYLAWREQKPRQRAG